MIVPLVTRDANRRINFNRSDLGGELLLSLMIDLSRLSGCIEKTHCTAKLRPDSANCSEENKTDDERKKNNNQEARPSRFSMLQRATYVADELVPRLSGKKRSKPQKVIIQLRQPQRVYGLVWLIAFASEQLPSYRCLLLLLMLLLSLLLCPKPCLNMRLKFYCLAFFETVFCTLHPFISSVDPRWNWWLEIVAH